MNSTIYNLTTNLLRSSKPIKNCVVNTSLINQSEKLFQRLVERQLLTNYSICQMAVYHGSIRSNLIKFGKTFQLNCNYKWAKKIFNVLIEVFKGPSTYLNGL